MIDAIADKNDAELFCAEPVYHVNTVSVVAHEHS
jgi:hypothetical protein